MPTERLSMRRIRQVLQLHFGVHASARVIAREVGVGRTSVQDYLARAGAAGLGWPLAPDLTDEALKRSNSCCFQRRAAGRVRGATPNPTGQRWCER